MLRIVNGRIHDLSSACLLRLLETARETTPQQQVEASASCRGAGSGLLVSTLADTSMAGSERQGLLILWDVENARPPVELGLLQTARIIIDEMKGQCSCGAVHQGFQDSDIVFHVAATSGVLQQYGRGSETSLQSMGIRIHTVLGKDPRKGGGKMHEAEDRLCDVSCSVQELQWASSAYKLHCCSAVPRSHGRPGVVATTLNA